MKHVENLNPDTLRAYLDSLADSISRIDDTIAPLTNARDRKKAKLAAQETRRAEARAKLEAEEKARAEAVAYLAQIKAEENAKKQAEAKAEAIAEAKARRIAEAKKLAG